MICIIALVIFAVLAVFSAKYRPLAAEAFDCVFRRVTFRKCNSNLDKRLKSQITGKIMKKHKAAGRFVFKYFEIFSWLFLVLMLLSVVQIGISVYNYSVYGNCNGLDESGFCILDPLGNNNPNGHEDLCGVTSPEGVLLRAPAIDALVSYPKTGSASAKVTFIEFGCFSCENTAVQAPAIRKLIEYFGKDVQFVYVDFPIPSHNYSFEAAAAASCVYEQDALTYWQYHFSVFEHQDGLSSDLLYDLAELYAVDMNAFDACMQDPATMLAINETVDFGTSLGIYGTPTMFLNGEPLVGVKNYKLLKAKIKKLLNE